MESFHGESFTLLLLQHSHHIRRAGRLRHIRHPEQARVRECDAETPATNFQPGLAQREDVARTQVEQVRVANVVLGSSAHAAHYAGGVHRVDLGVVRCVLAQAKIPNRSHEHATRAVRHPKQRERKRAARKESNK